MIVGKQAMGDARRRRLRAALERGMGEMHAEGQGVWQMHLFNLEGVMELAVKTAGGDASAGRVLTVLDDTVKNIHAVSDTDLPMLCMTCENALTRDAMPEVWVVVHASRDDPKICVANGVCSQCCERHEFDMVKIGESVTNQYRQAMIPDLRVLSPFSKPGHA